MFHPCSVLFKLLFSNHKEFYKKFKNVTGFFPHDHKIYQIAFIHRSASLVDDDGNILNNERLEFLGDAILNSIIGDFLYRKFPNANEGFLTQMRSKIVMREYLNDLALKMDLSQLLISNLTRSVSKKNLYGDAFEAFIGAVYLDKGYSFTRKYIIKFIIPEFIDLNQLENTDNNFKSQLIEWAQKYKKEFDFETDVDPDFQTRFISCVSIDNEVFGTGIGYSKKEAEQKASEQALNHLLEKGFY